MDYINLAPNQDMDENGLVFDLGSLYAYLQRVSDSRKAKGKVYSLGFLLVLMVLAKLGGEDKPSGMADWVAHRIEALHEMQIVAKKRAPSHMTYRRARQQVVGPEELVGAGGVRTSSEPAENGTGDCPEPGWQDLERHHPVGESAGDALVEHLRA